MTAEQEAELRTALERLQRAWAGMPYGALANMPWGTGNPATEPLVDKAKRLADGYESLREALQRVAIDNEAVRQELATVQRHRGAIRDLITYITAD